MALTGFDCLMEPRSIGTVVPAWTTPTPTCVSAGWGPPAGLLACIDECSFWRSQNDRWDASRSRDCAAPCGDRARQLDAHDAIRQSPEQAGRPAVRAHTVSRTSAVVALRATRTATFPLPKRNPLLPLAAWPAGSWTHFDPLPGRCPALQGRI